jgi:CRP-like cAMP-binding protein
VKPKRTTGFDVRAFLESAGLSRRIAEIPADAVIYAQGDLCEEVMYIQAGTVKLSVVSNTGREAVVRCSGRGLLRRRLSGGAAGPDGQRGRGRAEHHPVRQEEVDDHPAPQAARAVGPVHRPHAGAQHPDRGGPGRPVVQLERKRLARTLLLLARYGKHDQPVRAVPPMSQETLAEMVGTTRSRVNFFMKKFERLGFITYKDGLKVNNSLLTVILHD